MNLRYTIAATICLAFWTGCNEVPVRDERAAAPAESKPAVETANAPVAKQRNDEVVATDQHSRHWSGGDRESEPPQSRSKAPASKRDTIPNAADIGL